jgi:hypothetical protein
MYIYICMYETKIRYFMCIYIYHYVSYSFEYSYCQIGHDVPRLEQQDCYNRLAPHQLTSLVLDVLFWGMIHISCWWSSSRPFLAHREYGYLLKPTGVTWTRPIPWNSEWPVAKAMEMIMGTSSSPSRLPVKNWTTLWLWRTLRHGIDGP